MGVLDRAAAAARALGAQIRTLPPGCFALVMATGIVSIDASQHGMPRVALALFGINLLAFAMLLGMSLARAVRFPAALFADFTNPARGAGFLTLTAAACVLGTQCLLVVSWPRAATAFALLGAVSWSALIYLFLAATITRPIKPGFVRAINGGWLVAVVATQALSSLLTLRYGDDETVRFIAIALYMLGASLYLLIITLVAYRLIFIALRARDFTPPYWINMGALAISTVAGSLILTHAPSTGTLAALLPFIRGFTVLFWSAATWWIPLLLILDGWRHLMRRVPVAYETDDWDIVFPIGMYTVGTFELAQVIDLPLLHAIPAAGVYISIAAWLLVAVGGLNALRRAGLAGGTRH